MCKGSNKRRSNWRDWKHRLRSFFGLGVAGLDLVPMIGYSPSQVDTEHVWLCRGYLVLMENEMETA